MNRGDATWRAHEGVLNLVFLVRTHIDLGSFIVSDHEVRPVRQQRHRSLLQKLAVTKAQRG